MRVKLTIVVTIVALAVLSVPTSVRALSVGTKRLQDDTTSVDYYQRQFEFHRQRFLDNHEKGNLNVLRDAVSMALKYALKIPLDSARIAIMYMNLGSFYSNEPVALEHLRSAMTWSGRNADPVTRRGILNNMGLHFYRRLEMDSAIKYYSLGLEHCTGYGDPCVSIRNNYANCYMDIGDYLSAIDILAPVVFYVRSRFPDGHLVDDDGNLPSVYAHLLGNLVKCYLHTGDKIAANMTVAHLQTILSMNDVGQEEKLFAFYAMADELAARGELEQAMVLCDMGLESIERFDLSLADGACASFVIGYAEIVAANPSLASRSAEAIDLLLRVEEDRSSSRIDGVRSAELLALLYLRVGDSDKADSYMNEGRTRSALMQQAIMRTTHGLNRRELTTIVPTQAVVWGGVGVQPWIIGLCFVFGVAFGMFLLWYFRLRRPVSNDDQV